MRNPQHANRIWRAASVREHRWLVTRAFAAKQLTSSEHPGAQTQSTNVVFLPAWNWRFGVRATSKTCRALSREIREKFCFLAKINNSHHRNGPRMPVKDDRAWQPATQAYVPLARACSRQSPRRSRLDTVRSIDRLLDPPAAGRLRPAGVFVSL